MLVPDLFKFENYRRKFDEKKNLRKGSQEFFGVILRIY